VLKYIKSTTKHLANNSYLIVNKIVLSHSLLYTNTYFCVLDYNRKDYSYM